MAVRSNSLCRECFTLIFAFSPISTSRPSYTFVIADISLCMVR